MFRIWLVHLRHVIFCSKHNVSAWFMYALAALVTNLWDCDLHQTSIKFQSSVCINQPIHYKYIWRVLNHGFRTRPKTMPKRGQKIALETPQLQKICTIKQQQLSSSLHAAGRHANTWLDSLNGHMNKPGMTKDKVHQCKHKPLEAKITCQTVLFILSNGSTATKRILGRLSREGPPN